MSLALTLTTMALSSPSQFRSRFARVDLASLGAPLRSRTATSSVSQAASAFRDEMIGRR
jgi:hypothetical protein